MVAAVALLLLPPLLAAPVVFYFFRHWTLTALIVLVPLPAGLLALVLRDWVSLSSFEYFCGIFVAGLMADEFVVAFAGGESKPLSMRSANYRIVPALAAFVIIVVMTLVWVAVNSPAALLPSAERFGLGLALTFISTTGLMQLCRALRYEEAFIAHTNRFRERAERQVDRLLLLTQPRWAFAMTGSAIVLVVIALLGFGPDVIQKSVLAGNLFAGPILVATLAAVSAAVLRNWRTALAAVFVTAWVMLIRLPDLLSHREAAIFVFCLAAQIAIYARSGDEMTIAVGRALTRSALGVVAMVAVSIPFVVIELIFFLAQPQTTRLATLEAAGVEALAALIFLPAFAVAIEALFPRRETLEARYRVH